VTKEMRQDWVGIHSVHLKCESLFVYQFVKHLKGNTDMPKGCAARLGLRTSVTFILCDRT
jgi:hypothetical protein